MLIGVYGASGFGREVMPIARDCYAQLGGEIVFIDDAAKEQSINGHALLTFQEFRERPEAEKRIAIAIADGAVRKGLFERVTKSGVKIVDICSAHHIRGDAVEVGAGAILCGYAQITSNVHIGIGFHGNIYSYVAHDCVIGDFVTFAPHVHCNGNVHIGERAYIGTGAIIRQGTPEKPLMIGAGAIVGMGAVVTKDVPPGITVIGNPARPMTPRS